VKPEHNADEPP